MIIEKGKLTIVRLVVKNGTHTLLRRSYEDIGMDFLPIMEQSIVLVLFLDSYDGLERSIWCHKNGSVPFLGDINNIQAAAITAEQFKVDTILCDSHSLAEYIENEEIAATVKNIVVIDRIFKNTWILRNVQRRFECSLFLSLPDTGIIGTVRRVGKLKSRLHVKALPGIFIECVENMLVVTKNKGGESPVRYVTDIQCVSEEKKIYL